MAHLGMQGCESQPQEKGHSRTILTLRTCRKTALFIQSEHVRRHARSTKDKAPSRDLEQRALDRGRVERQAAGITNAMSNSSDRRRPGVSHSEHLVLRS